MLRLFTYTILMFSSLAVSAQVGSWENLSTLTEIRALLPLENKILLASNGGILNFDSHQKTFEYGIMGQQSDNLDIHAIYLDSDGLLWIGSRSPGPIIEVLNLLTNDWLQVEFVDLDQVNSFVQVGDSTYATFQDGINGGLLLYRKNESQIEYLDIFNNFPDQYSLDLTTVNDVVFLSGRLVFRTNLNILWIELDGSNLKDPANWHVDLLPENSVEMSRLVVNGNDLLLSAGTKLFEYNFTGFNELAATESIITDLKIDRSQQASIVFATDEGVFTFDPDNGVLQQQIDAMGIMSIAVRNGTVWTGANTDFLSVLSEGNYLTYSANRPRDHYFNRMMVNSREQLVGAANNGISIYDSQGWRTIRPGNFNTSFDETMYDWNQMIIDTLSYKGNAVVEDMISDQSDNLYFSLQGKGVLKLDQNQPTESVFYNVDNGILEPTFDSDIFILPGQMAMDKKENIWLTTKFVQDGGKVITILGADGGIYHIDQYSGGLNSRTVKSIAVDNNNLVWVGSQVRSDLQALGGIDLIDYHDTMTEPMDISVSSLLGSPLASNEILQLEIDSRNTLWILTPAGVQSMPLPDQWLNTVDLKNWASLYMTPKEADYYYYWQLTDYNVTGIEIDQRGNHWFLSSNSGVHVLLENGRWINGGFGYNTGNSGLIDNEIYSMAFNSSSGQAYFSTPKGISILNTPFADPVASYSNIHIYPQPFNPDIHDRVIIQGLMDNSSVKILTISGSLVKELTSKNSDVQGYEAQWNGRDNRGELVGSGVYILYLFNEDGAAASQKLAILR